MKPIFLSSLLILFLFALNVAFPYQHECDTDKTEQASYQAPQNANNADLIGQFLVTPYDSCMMNPKHFELPPDDYKGSLKDWFAAHPMPKIQACKNCHKISNSPSDNSPIENGLSPNQQAYKNRTRQENEQAAYQRMMDNYKREEDESISYTEIVKKYFADGNVRRP